MTEEEVKVKIKECKFRLKIYKTVLKNIDILKLAIARSIATEYLNIADYKKQLKEQEE